MITRLRTKAQEQRELSRQLCGSLAAVAHRANLLSLSVLDVSGPRRSIEAQLKEASDDLRAVARKLAATSSTDIVQAGLDAAVASAELQRLAFNAMRSHLVDQADVDRATQMAELTLLNVIEALKPKAG